ncbi:MAG: DUF6326 family protein [Chitinophagaceae bacterium]
MKRTNGLTDFTIHVKFKLSALWAAVMFCYIYGDYFSLYVPKQIDEFISGTTRLNSPIKLFAASAMMSIPALMVFLSLLLKPAINKWLNIIFGVFFSAIMIVIAISSIESWWAFYFFLAIIEILITSLVVWFAWTWPKQG